MDGKIQFIGEVKKVEAKALVSLDKSYRVTIDTMDVAALGIGAWPADETVSVHIERNPK
jgi:hypothetical protein